MKLKKKDIEDQLKFCEQAILQNQGAVNYCRHLLATYEFDEEGKEEGK